MKNRIRMIGILFMILALTACRQSAPPEKSTAAPPPGTGEETPAGTSPSEADAPPAEGEPVRWEKLDLSCAGADGTVKTVYTSYFWEKEETERLTVLSSYEDLKKEIEKESFRGETAVDNGNGPVYEKTEDLLDRFRDYPFAEKSLCLVNGRMATMPTYFCVCGCRTEGSQLTITLKPTAVGASEAFYPYTLFAEVPAGEAAALEKVVLRYE